MKTFKEFTEKIDENINEAFKTEVSIDKILEIIETIPDDCWYEAEFRVDDDFFTKPSFHSKEDLIGEIKKQHKKMMLINIVCYHDKSFSKGKVTVYKLDGTKYKYNN